MLQDKRNNRRRYVNALESRARISRISDRRWVREPPRQWAGSLRRTGLSKWRAAGSPYRVSGAEKMCSSGMCSSGPGHFSRTFWSTCPLIASRKTVRSRPFAAGVTLTCVREEPHDHAHRAWHFRETLDDVLPDVRREQAWGRGSPCDSRNDGRRVRKNVPARETMAQRR
jgi:hypothetical protein